jgi:hypothetical protein
MTPTRMRERIREAMTVTVQYAHGISTTHPSQEQVEAVERLFEVMLREQQVGNGS